MRVELVMTRRVRRAFRRALWRHHLSEPQGRWLVAWWLLTVLSVLLVGAVGPGAIGLLVLFALLALGASTGIRRAVRARSWSPEVERLELRLDEHGLRVGAPGAEPGRVDFCELPDGVRLAPGAAWADHVLGGRMMWPAGLFPPPAVRWVGERLGPRDATADPAPTGARDVRVDAGLHRRLLPPLWRRTVLVSWREAVVLAAVLALAGRAARAPELYVAAAALVLVAPWGTRRQLRTRLTRCYPPGTTVRLQARGNRLVVDTATYHLEIEGSAVQWSRCVDGVVAVWHETDGWPQSDALLAAWLPERAWTALDLDPPHDPRLDLPRDPSPTGAGR